LVATTSSHMVDSRIMWWSMSGTFNGFGSCAYTDTSRRRHRHSAPINSHRAYVH
jgi:hypothetical protein